MNIQTVIANLLKTIEGKEALLAEFQANRKVATMREDIGLRAVINFLELNLKELNAILADCMKVREADIVADLERKDAERKAVEDSWRDSPDRMGGQFTQDEINNTGWI
ncbi:hypothetical protein [Flavobacterium sp.]|jgi:hypothetical protein|uniref:hypothetical protein n=1 Tax=Flavobacterium sp. TaxID=239 RepID=UPI0037BE601F